jgi:fatty-acyl-CoA synthase
LAKRDEDGYYYLVDRATDMYISGGENVYPAEVERVLRQHPAVVEAAVVGRPDHRWGEVGHAFIQKASGTDLTEADLMAFFKGRLARYKWPRTVEFCDGFECTSLGKIKKHMLSRDE